MMMVFFEVTIVILVRNFLFISILIQFASSHFVFVLGEDILFYSLTQ